MHAIAYVLLCTLVLALLAAVACIDARTQKIPNPLNLCLLGCGVLFFFLGPPLPPLARLAGLFCVSVPLLLITIFLPGSFGMGDVKLMAACGLILGWNLVLAAAVLAVLLGGLQGVYFLVTRKKKRGEHFAFGPALCIGVAFALLAGDHLIAGYAALLFLGS